MPIRAIEWCKYKQLGTAAYTIVVSGEGYFLGYSYVALTAAGTLNAYDSALTTTAGSTAAYKLMPQGTLTNSAGTYHISFPAPVRFTNGLRCVPSASAKKAGKVVVYYR